MESRVSKSFEDLLVWQKAHALVLDIYRLTNKFPKDELYGLTQQIRNSSRSIAANIAEGYKKYGKLDKLRFYNISQGSLEETRYYIILSKDLGYIEESVYQVLIKQLIDISQLLNAYYNAIKKSI
ncbi:four helix bundle protein [Tenuifilum thalassicum]|uniref:Four helix bundle protein n=1 Tax=Tenuifilum thalassicum TaxID=2590900 RepID=A0A7D3XCA0_9BACT|nr:four helix bundle protein [Tenuifilum thalassicum]QKG78912.1 four helix bundle protein [Tenuifilum thalassicum]